MRDSNSKGLNVVLHCHQDKSNMGTRISLCPYHRQHEHSMMLQTVSLKGQNLPSTSNWNVPTEILSGYLRRFMCQAWHIDQMLHQKDIQWFYPWAAKAVKKSWNAASCLTGLLCLQAKSISLTKRDKIKYTQQNVRISTYEPVNANCCDK